MRCQSHKENTSRFNLWKVVVEPWKTPGFLASGVEEFNLGSETRLNHSEFLCNKVLLKYKREKAPDIGIRRGQKEYPLPSVSNGVIYLFVFKQLLKWIKRMSGGCKDLTRPTPIIYIFKITGLARSFFPETVLRTIHYCYIILRNVEGKKKSLSFPSLWEFQTSPSLGTSGFLINLPRNWLSHLYEISKILRLIGNNRTVGARIWEQGEMESYSSRYKDSVMCHE